MMGPMAIDQSVKFAGAHQLGIERLCVFGMPPVEFVTLAADLDCRWVGMGLTAMRYYNPHGYRDWSLRDDPALRRETVSAMRDSGVGLSLMEGFGIQAGTDPRDMAGDLDIVCELGGTRINAASMDRDAQRTFDGFAVLAEMADTRGIEVSIEIGPGPVGNMAAALNAVRHVNRKNFRLLIDTMHYFRRGGSMAEFTAVDPALIGYVQLCDAPLVSSFASYMEEALYERMVPGTGDLPLRDFLAAVPPEVIVSMEIPQRSLAAAGVGPHDRVGACLDAARALTRDKM